jgi:hypothetical protein
MTNFALNSVTLGTLSKAKGAKATTRSKSKKGLRHNSQKREDGKGSIRIKTKSKKGTIKGTSAKQRPKIPKNYFNDPKTVKYAHFIHLSSITKSKFFTLFHVFSHVHFN